MLRLSCLAARRLGQVQWSDSTHLLRRHASTAGGKSGGGAGKVVAGTVLLTVGVAGGTVGYASVDTDFRKTVEETVPGSDEVLSMILGPIPAPPKPKVLPSKLRIPGPVVVTEPKPAAKKVDSPPPTPAVEPPKPVINTVVAPPLEPPPPPPPAPEVAPVPPPPPPPPAEPSPPPPPAKEAAPPPADQPSLDEALLTPDVENGSLEQVLIELCKEMKSATSAAVEGYDLSSEAVVAHINIMQRVLESNLSSKDESAWNQVFEAASAKSDAVKFAEVREREAEAAIRNVLESIEAGRKNKITSTNPQLIVAEEAANRALYQLEQSKARISAVEGEARVMEQYRDLVEEGRQQFHREMASIMPDVKLGEKNSKLTEDELNMFITHAYRKVLHLQQELAKQQTLEQQRFKQSLEKQRLEAQMSASEKIDNELERQKRELEVEHQRRLAAIREEAEGDLRAQLRRQAAAHSDHLADVLTVQETELSRKHKHELDEKLSEAESAYLTGVAGLKGRLQGIEAALEARADSDKTALEAQRLWLACVAMENSIREGNSSATSWEECAKPLSQDVTAIKTVAGKENEFVAAVVDSLPTAALSRGVYTEQSLRERFCRVEQVANRVGNIGEEGGSLLRYGLSYLQSMLLVDLSKRRPGVSDEPIDISALGTTEILSLAKFSLEEGDIGQAVQYMSLLKGEPRRVARDWVDEARLHLEARQAAQALQAHAACQGSEVLPTPAN